ncbi:MAG TPA: DUF1844 domain-containing protein [Candidatus Binatia bacterium]|nr:DUF1844 domain-containing protein [Candidatus Binatia bacterium]
MRDRRRFAETGEAREAPPPEPPGSERPAAAEARPDEPVTFVTFVLGLSTQALLHLGDIESPVSHAVERDLGAAKQVIDILGILREKTRNNLEASEESLLDSILYDLRMRYVALVRGTAKEGT